MFIAIIAMLTFGHRVPDLTAADFHDVGGAVSQSLAGGGGNTVHWLLLVHAPTCSLCNALRPVWLSVSNNVARATDVTGFFVGRVDGAVHDHGERGEFEEKGRDLGASTARKIRRRAAMLS